MLFKWKAILTEHYNERGIFTCDKTVFLSLILSNKIMSIWSKGDDDDNVGYNDDDNDNNDDNDVGPCFKRKL